MTATLTDSVRDSLRLYLIQDLPTRITAVNAARPVRTVADAVSTANSATVTSATAAFTDADLGQPYSLSAAGPGGRPHLGVIVTRVNATTVTVDPVPLTSASGQTLGIGKRTLASMQRWVASPLIATPQPPALGVLPQSSGLRTAGWAMERNEWHALLVYLQTANADEELLEQDLVGYGAALVNSILHAVDGGGQYANGMQLLLGTGGEAAESCLFYGERRPVGNLFYGDVSLAVSAINTEAA